MNVVLLRDLTDAMYDPRDKPYVSHERGTELVIEHIERWWAPSVLSRDFVEAAATAIVEPDVSPGPRQYATA